MTHKQFPELNFLLQKAEEKYAHRITVPKDFELLAENISQTVHERISASTLKRLWGYDAYDSTPSPVTLDILAKYVDAGSFKKFCESLKQDPAYSSGFLHTEHIESRSLQPGDTLEIAWNPNRLVTLSYLGNYCFRVVESQNASLASGDEFEAVIFLKGYPLYLAQIERKGEVLPAYVAGIQNGLTRVAKL